MGRTLLNIRPLLIIALCAISFNSVFGQISAPGRDWQGETEYFNANNLSESFDLMTSGNLPNQWVTVTNSTGWVLIDTLSYSQPNSILISKDATRAKNDWIFTPLKKFENGKTYKLIFYIKAPSISGEFEKLEVKIGNAQTPVAMTQSLFKNETIRIASWTMQSVEFTVPTTGYYCLGFYAYSNANISYIAIDNIAVKVKDPIYVFFSTPDNPKLGNLSATFSDGSNSTFKWYKYNPTGPVSDRFQLFGTSDLDVPTSNRTSLNAGGYRVEVVRTSDDSTEVYYAWLFVDSVVFSSVFVENTCDFMFLEARTVPDRPTIFYEFFSYYDLSTSGHSIINKIGANYFKTIAWEASNTQIHVPTTSSLSIVIEEPAPLYNSTYTIKLVNPFGRELTITSPEIVAKATKADFNLFINKGNEIAPNWQDGGEKPQGEALLEIKLESKSINADSIFWNIINKDEYFFLNGLDSIIWRKNELMLTESVETYPPKSLMVPGMYNYKHISLKVASGCRDTMFIKVEVEPSIIKPEAIPNVFVPNSKIEGNQLFKFKDPDVNLKSIMQFSISIYSRWGNRVYTYTGGNPREWDGWNGKIDGKYGDAAPGVYYYVIEATGWDGRRYNDGVYKGFLHLFRGE